MKLCYVVEDIGEGGGGDWSWLMCSTTLLKMSEQPLNPKGISDMRRCDSRGCSEDEGRSKSMRSMMTSVGTTTRA
jgi:hypothetical protein